MNLRCGKNILLAVFLLGILVNARAAYAAEDSLNRAIKKLIEAKNFRYDFSQSSLVVNMEETFNSEGYMLYEAPKEQNGLPRIYLEYFKPETEKQILVFDGKILWTYRKSVNQVSKQTISAADMKQNAMLFFPQWLGSLLEKSTVTAQGQTAEKVDKYLVRPLQMEEETFQKVDLNINQQEDLESYVLLDKQNNKIEIKIKEVKYDITIDPQKFVFTPPPDTEVIESFPVDRITK